MSLRTTDPDGPGAFARLTIDSARILTSPLQCWHRADLHHTCSLMLPLAFRRVGIEATRMNAPTEHDPLEIVSTRNLERELTLVRGAAAGSLAGVFGPRSITWQVDREAAIFLGAGRALLLQLAHPWVAAAIEQHSDTFANPVGRFHRTFSTVFTMVFGTLAQSLEAARRLHHRHASITGTLRSAAGPFPAGSFYCANEASALRWVHATLAETAVMAYALVLPALTPEQRERYYAESRLFGALFGIPREHLALLVGNGAGYSQLDKLRGTFGKDVDNFCNIDPVPAQLLNPDWILLNNVLPIAKEKYGGFDAEAVRKAALDVDIPPGGTIQGYGVKFYPPGTQLSGQNERSTPAVMQNAGEHISVVWPANIKTQEPVLPLPASSIYAMR